VTCGDDDTAIALAIACVADTQKMAGTESARYSQQVVDYLMGEVDGVPKDAKHLFRLYISVRMFREAAKTASIIAREEQMKGGANLHKNQFSKILSGQYRLAHDVLYGMYKELQRESMTVPYDMYNGLMLIHSYLIIKVGVSVCVLLLHPSSCSN
jgi:WD repeat-containing protein 19